MRVEIHRHRMASRERPDGSIDVAYDVLVPLTNVCPGIVPGHTILKTPRELTTIEPAYQIEYVAFDQATWRPADEPGWKRWSAWLTHEKVARALAEALIREHCSEARDHEGRLTFWIPVPRTTRLSTVILNMEVPADDGRGTIAWPSYTRVLGAAPARPAATENRAKELGWGSRWLCTHRESHRAVTQRPRAPAGESARPRHAPAKLQSPSP